MEHWAARSQLFRRCGSTWRPKVLVAVGLGSSPTIRPRRTAAIFAPVSARRSCTEHAQGPRQLGPHLQQGYCQVGGPPADAGITTAILARLFSHPGAQHLGGGRPILGEAPGQSLQLIATAEFLAGNREQAGTPNRSGSILARRCQRWTNGRRAMHNLRRRETFSATSATRSYVRPTWPTPNASCWTAAWSATCWGLTKLSIPSSAASPKSGAPNRGCTAENAAHPGPGWSP